MPDEQCAKIANQADRGTVLKQCRTENQMGQYQRRHEDGFEGRLASKFEAGDGNANRDGDGDSKQRGGKCQAR
ncbi:hypothetical protein D3C71_1913730 [compost metagenome]